jgi:hypothetical protein
MTYRKPVGPRGLGNIRRASAIWGRGETVLAEIHLARSGLPRLPDEDAPFRLFAAERILTAGITPRDLLKACGLDSSPLDLVKAGYDPDEPRVPAGDPDGGQWTTGGAEPKTPAAPREQLEPVNFTPVHRLPNDAVVVTPPDGKPVADPDSPTKKLMLRLMPTFGRSMPPDDPLQGCPIRSSTAVRVPLSPRAAPSTSRGTYHNRNSTILTSMPPIMQSAYIWPAPDIRCQ